MEMTSLIIVGVVVLVAIITIIGILSRYRKCKSDELLVVYGKTGSHKEKVSERDAKGNLVDREVEAVKSVAILEAEAEAAKILKAAEAKANATKMQLEAEAEGTKKKLLAEAEGKKASLMAEAEQKQAMEMAPALAVEHMIKSGMHPEAIVQYAMTDRWKEVAEANAKVFEHIQLGNVTVYGDSNTAGQFMANMAKNLAPSLEIARNLPIADSLKQIITGKKPEESPAKGDNFPPVK